MKLVCMSKYSNVPRQLFFEAGEIQVEADIGEFLLRDAPENFELTIDEPPKVETTSIDNPPKDKAIHSPRSKKVVGK